MNRFQKSGLIVVILLIVAVISVIVVNTNDMEKISITFQNNAIINAEVAVDLKDQVIGLSGRESLDPDSGMLFVYESEDIRNFWMRGMNFPIDIIWIKDDTVVGFEENVPMPGNSDEIARVSSDVAVDMVLEVSAGFCAKNSLVVGDSLDIDL
ncbi:MAG: hypothetical protein ACD_76C00029G0006 [uncultured bacterium]|nr:MAG: hypothetical protein ACD_76C00029G0006 [uncultured bacterium]